MRDTPPVDQSFLLGLLGYNCLQAYLKLSPPIKKLLAKYKLRPVEFTVLSVIAENPQINQKRLSEAINVSPPNMATLLDRMQDEGLLTRQRNPRDKRSQILALTEHGASLYDKARWQLYKLEAAPNLNTEEHEHLIRLLQKIFL